MEKITYRLTLDTFKGGIQKVLRGVYTGDVLSRRVAISLSAGSVPCKISDEESIVSAVMYVTKPSGVTNYGNCEILDNVVYYDIIQYDVDVEGIVEMQLKVMSEDSVLYAPVFALEVQQSKNSDIIAEQSPQFTALEAALAKAEEVYRKRLVSIELTDDLVFIAHYGDNSTYESDAIKNALAFVDDAEKARVIAENERVLAEEQRVLAELERVLAEQRRDSNYNNLWASLNEVIEDTEELQRYVESLVEEGFITESRVLELIEEHGGGAVPDNVLVASEESAQTEPAPKVNADLFGGKTPSDFASAEDIENITNGTTQVGNAKTLDGHEAEYFAPKTDLANYLPLTGGTLTKGSKITFEKTDDSTLSGNVDISVSKNSFGISEKGGNIRGVTLDLTECANWNGSKFLHTGNMTDHVLPLSGGTTSGDIEVKGATGASRFKATSLNGNYNMSLVATNDGYTGLYDTVNGKWMAQHTPDGTNTFNGTASGNLSLTGGTVGDGDKLEPLRLKGTTAALMGFTKSDGGVLGYLGINGSGNPMFQDANNVGRSLLHTGNKPTGTYTGDGSAYKSIVIGGIGEYVLVSTNISGQKSDFVLVSYNGYFGKVNGSLVSGNNMYTTTGGNLIIDSVSEFLVSGRQYRYERL